MKTKVLSKLRSENHELQSRLNALSNSETNSFLENTWHFDHPVRNIVIDFDDILQIQKTYPDWEFSKSFDLILITKKAWLLIVTPISPSNYVSRLHGLKLFWSALAYNNFSQANQSNISEILSFILLNAWRSGEAKKGFSIKSHGYYSVQFQLSKTKIALSDSARNIICRNLTESHVRVSLKALIPALSKHTLTYQDWRLGGTLNQMTLDYGRYYVEHCINFFSEHYPLASALSSTQRELPVIAESLGYKLRTVNPPAQYFLRGYSVHDLKNRWPRWSTTALQRIHKAVTQHFKDAYKQALFESLMLKEKFLISLGKNLGLEPLPENIDRLSVTAWDWVHRQNKFETEQILSEFHHYISLSDFEDKLNFEKNRLSKEPVTIPTDNDYRSIGLTEKALNNPYDSCVGQFIRLVSKAGVTIVVALTGWRRSEFGFPLTSINRIPNDDKLDQYALPWRYQVDWYVKKTSGNVRRLREITFYTYAVAEMLHLLHRATDDQPFLYRIKSLNDNPTDSSQIIDRTVRYMWSHFVKNYSGFKLLDDRVSCHDISKSENTKYCSRYSQNQDFAQLLPQRSAKEWQNLSIDVNLREAWRRARDELPRLELLLSRNSITTRKQWLIKYRDRALETELMTVLDKYLPEDIKEWINSLSEEDLKSMAITRSVMNILIDGTLYPSPHAFRHMWAEAVYRRFDGDVGWMIRSQFKHVSRSMWLAYIRDKDNRNEHELIKAQVISSLVHNYLLHKGEGYSGYLHTWLRRLYRKTSVVSPEDCEKITEQLALSEIENIKANPWGYCLLRRRARNKAKCAEMGEPMRHNAAPELCLGCAHNLMQSSNVEWSLFHAASHVEALRNPLVPQIFKKSSYKLVKQVAHHVRSLKPDHESLVELDATLNANKHLRNL